MKKYQRKLEFEICMSAMDFTCLNQMMSYDLEPSLSEWLRAALERYAEILYVTSDGEVSHYIFKEPPTEFGTNIKRFVLYLDPIDYHNFESICGLLNLPTKGSLSKVCRMMIRDSYAECGGYI